ncbi:MAG: transglutaminase family protein [Pirellulaceae bacterium]|nr:transglutaminase family protein [Pirellulaceae bacterium]
MSIRVALNHVSRYRYDRLTSIGPQIVRLRPAPHCRTSIVSYSLSVQPSEHFRNWQQDPHGNFLARYVFPKPARELCFTVDLVCDLSASNPFDFFVDQEVLNFPFSYEPSLATDLKPFLETQPNSSLLTEFISSLHVQPQHTITLLVDINQRIQQAIRYLIRPEPGVQTPQQTLELRSGSCRDSAWLLVQILRHLGLAARFVSGYLIQLVPDIKPLDGPAGASVDFTDLHAWVEAYIPGAGWIGLDPTSGLLAGEGHIPLAATPHPSSAAPISGSLSECEVDFSFAMSISRICEAPRVTKPYRPQQWQSIVQVGHEVDRRLQHDDVRLTMGGEPTFVSIDDMDGVEWNSAAVGPHKRRLSEILIRRLRERLAPGALLHYGQGKWYPGEPLPRWALACLWRKDHVPIWNNSQLLADSDQTYSYGIEDAKQFTDCLAERLALSPECILPAFEDAAYYSWQEQRLPVNVDPQRAQLQDPEERSRLARVFEQGLDSAVGYVLPMRSQWWQSKGAAWQSMRWPVRAGRVFLMPGDSPIGLRLPLEFLSAAWPSIDELWTADPSAPLQALVDGRQPQHSHQLQFGPGQGASRHPSRAETVEQRQSQIPTTSASVSSHAAGAPVVRTALCIEPRDGRLHLFIPPVERLEDYLDLIAAIEDTAERLSLPVVIEGYLPPTDHRLKLLKVTPDPGVIEVNIHPSGSWDELVSNTTDLYEEARLSRLGTEKFDLDGKHSGTGGGNHIVLGSYSTTDSPFLRRPDLLHSLIVYWNNHPSLSYLFSGRFIGPTSQAPRLDEGRRDAVYELQLALALVPTVEQQQAGAPIPPWLVDRIFRNLLTDITGNTHRAEICIDKLYSPDHSSGRLGLVELRGFEMPPHAEMSLAQQLLIRALVSHFWRSPYRQPPIVWGTSLHDRFMLPHYLWTDFDEVIDQLNQAGIAIERDWFLTHFEFRFPLIGSVVYDDIQLELRQALEPWHVLGEQPSGQATVRYVDSSVERLQVRLTGLVSERYCVTCNGRRVPLRATGSPGEYVAGVRFRAWQPPQCLHPTIPVHAPLVFDIVDIWSGRAVGGCTYHVAHPAGRNYDSFPVNSLEAAARRAARFHPMGHSPGGRDIPRTESSTEFPLTLDLRRSQHSTA